MTKSKVNFFEVERAGINTTFQDSGRKNFNHIGFPVIAPVTFPKLISISGP